MDYLLIDVNDIDDLHVGEEVVLLGKQGAESISAQELMVYGESVSGEVTCVISKRVPRKYYQSSEKEV